MARRELRGSVTLRRLQHEQRAHRSCHRRSNEDGAKCEQDVRGQIFTGGDTALACGSAPSPRARAPRPSTRARSISCCPCKRKSKKSHGFSVALDRALPSQLLALHAMTHDWPILQLSARCRAKTPRSLSSLSLQLRKRYTFRSANGCRSFGSIRE